MEKTSEKTSEKIIDLIKENDKITINELTNNIGVSSRSIERNIENLKKTGYLKRIGPAKGGHWKVIDNKE